MKDNELVNALYKFIAAKKYDLAYECLRNLWQYYGKECRNDVLSYRNTLTRVIRDGNDKSAELMDYLKKAYFLTASAYFEDYLIAVEWDRPYEAKFYMPRMCYLSRLVNGYQKILDNDIDLLTVSLPKRAGKSQLGINFTCMMSGIHPDRSTLMEGAGDALINSFYVGCLEYMSRESEYNYYDIFPDTKIVQTKADLHTINLNEKSRFPTIMCRSIDATQVGLSEATNMLYLDDCITGYEEAQSRQRLDDKWDIINGDVIGRALEGTPIVACGTRYSLYDVIGHLQTMGKEKGLRMETFEIPALDPKTDESNYEFFNPKLGRKQFTTQFFRNERASLAPQQFASEFQQEPFEAKGQLFPEARLNRYFTLPADKDPDTVIAVCDTSEGKGDSTMMPIAFIYGDDVFIEDVVFDGSTPEHTKPECANLLVKYGVARATFESNLAGEYFARDVEEQVKKLGGKCSIRTKRTISNKKTRIENASDDILNHFFFKDKSLYTPSSQYGQMIRELVSYTRTGKNPHDDSPDGLSLLAGEIRGQIASKVSIMNRFF